MMDARDGSGDSPGTTPLEQLNIHGRGEPHVIIVDDDSDILDVMDQLLSEDGFDVTTCTAYEQALTALNTTDAALLITDLRLGGNDGLDLIRHVQHAARGRPRVILLTALRVAETETIMQLVKAVDARIVSKPFDVEQLLQVARELTDWPGAQA
jgi:DNA-binding response OmpR family regulator